VFHGHSRATDNALDLCSHRSSGRWHHLSGQRVRQPLYSTALQRYPRTVASKHYHQRKIQLRQRSPSLAEYAKGRLAWAAACQASTASV
jgi:hypothetical protein